MIRLAMIGCAMLGLGACGMFGGKPAPRAAEPVALAEQVSPFAVLLPWNASRRDLQSTPDGVQYVAIRRGDPSGPRPGPADRVEIAYDARIAATGKPVESTRPGQPAMFRLSDVVPGLSTGLQAMVPGDQFMFFIPARLAYGAEAIGPVPANSDLVFLATLERIVPGRAADKAGWARAQPWPAAGAEGVIRTASGLEYMILHASPGGPHPTDADIAMVHYEGRLDSGRVIDSSFERGGPDPFPVAGVIPGFSEALKLMRPGDRWIIRVPPGLGYGAAGAGGVIPPNSWLTFEIELESAAPAR